MKKLIMPLLALVICLCQVNFADAQNASLQKKLNKMQTKQYKAKVKELKKGKWEVFGTANTLEVALLQHYNELAKEGTTEIMGITTSTNKNIGKDKIYMSAISDYAKTSGSNIRARIVDDMGSTLGTEEMAEFEHFYAAYENAVEKEIKGEVQPSFMIYRELSTKKGNTMYEFQGYYIVNEDAASKARIRAFENAAKESAVAQKYAEKVSGFIREAFE